MVKNVGNLDRIIRVILAVALVVLTFVLGVDTWWGLLILAGALLVTAAVGMCGIYRLFGINTCPRPTQK